jgi:hypothetical protein
MDDPESQTQSEGSTISIPRWIRIATRVYSSLGLKTLFLFCLLALYQLLGAIVFYLCEASNDRLRMRTWTVAIHQNRTRMVETIVEGLKTIGMLSASASSVSAGPNQTVSESGFGGGGEWEDSARAFLHKELDVYAELPFSPDHQQKLRWDFWNAMLYAQSIYTTIGYGHMYASTTAGKVATMVYALFGIPLLLTILDDLGSFVDFLITLVFVFGFK